MTEYTLEYSTHTELGMLRWCWTPYTYSWNPSIALTQNFFRILLGAKEIAIALRIAR